MGDEKDVDAQGSSADIPNGEPDAGGGATDIWNAVAAHQKNLKTFFAREFRDRPLVIGEGDFRIEITEKDDRGERRDGADRRIVVDRRAMGDRRLGLELRDDTAAGPGQLWQQSKNSWVAALFKTGGGRPTDRRRGVERRLGADRRIGFDRRR